MATILLSAAGAFVGAGFGGTILGLSGAVIGRAIGATIGRMIDQRVLGSGSRAVETGRIDRYRLTSASEGAPVGLVWGRMRVSGQVIWATRFREHVATSGGGKGMPSQPTVTEYSYSVSLAVALGEGEITRVGRIWADGVEISPDEVTMRVYTGAYDQLPDPKIEAVEGAGAVPAYRGIAYVVFEDLPVTRFGNRVPQLSFEVFRPAQGPATKAVADLREGVRGVALIPGTGEYALATTPVHYQEGVGRNVSANVHSPVGGTDFSVSLRALREELPNCGSVSLLVSWFGSDLRCAACEVKPKVEYSSREGQGMAWRAGGVKRHAAEMVARKDDRPVYGGTPADASVVEAIAAIRADGQAVMFCPFILMDQLEGNGLTDPWDGSAEQSVLPWRGRITLSVAPGRSGSPDRTAAAGEEVAAFFGTVQASDFTVSGTTITYAGPAEWSYRRFVLHYAHLCAAAGGVDAFLIGSELRGLTGIRGADDAFVAVEALRHLAADVRSILGPQTKISYAADWSEYNCYQDGSGDLLYPLDALWADPNVDFVAIDNYLPLSDWREGTAQADAHWGTIYNLDYLKANVEGGEYYDWYYACDAHRVAQIRTPIEDGAHGEPWVWRLKDFRSWWENAHHERIGGIRQSAPTAWEPRSKPIWFAEYGCAAIDRGTNEPNKFLDPKSSESALPFGSDGRRDDLIQMQYLRAMREYWDDPARNPVSDRYDGRMIDMEHAHVWSWDARPFPQFPGDTALWSDGENYARGHWLNGRAASQPLASVVAEICDRSGLRDIDVSQLHGFVRGYGVSDVGTGRAGLQPLMLAFGFDAAERDGVLSFRMRDGRPVRALTPDHLAVTDDLDGWTETDRAPEAELAGRVRLNFVEAEGDYEARSVEAIFPDERTQSVSQSELNLSLTRSEGQRIVERWLSEARVARDSARFAVPPSAGALAAGDVVTCADRTYRIDQVERAGALQLDAVRVESAVYEPSDEAEERVTPRPFAPPLPVAALFLDLPLLSGDEVPHAPHIAATAEPWPGTVAVYASDADAGYALDQILTVRSIMGQTLTPLASARPGIWDRGGVLRVNVTGGALSSVGSEQVLNGANLMAIGDGTPTNWEVLQFQEALLVGPDTYDLRHLLRGQVGTDAIAPDIWPVGSHVVLLDGAPRQIGLSVEARDLSRHFRIGPATRSYDDPSYLHLVEAFPGIGLRPYAPAHLRGAWQGGDLSISWVRRTRVSGDSWSGIEVPLGESREAYVVRIVQNGAIRREITVGLPYWTYAQALIQADAVAAPFEIHVAQLSDAFGPGAFTRMNIND
ncbi:glycoside hydrolase TIM-barrel-like domain-containing protein [Albidovulum sediminicola]|uniref:Glycoside hydrolase TIM-barrel-like domain-containing protein n=1 Tax=Albidovulum sediminicola TaxID=2984331 RepID=A0ABT2Z0G4_9RHOB|nr:glycoside hydrolase TIM-barrel-like domain-containing protein [Defluviimonas sp. WL0075]MCV2864638.1 glycoside hydrolase TIM-barrel-like domain-containing protein [Defluviimonas sp. WL0075]